MDSIVLHLQGMAIDPKNSVTDLLRLAKTIATKLEDSDALKWIDLELKGYGERFLQELPSYRRILGQPYACDKYGNWHSISFEKSETYENAATAPIGQALNSIEATLKKMRMTPQTMSLLIILPKQKAH